MRNTKKVSIDLFPAGIPEDIFYICDKLKKNGFDIYLVGGAVRDSVLAGGVDKARVKASDFDFTTNAKPDQIMAIFKEKGKSHIYTIPTGLAHGTVTVVIEQEDINNHYEITTYRLDGKYLDGRHPVDVVFSSTLEEDLSRRDFTINAMAYDCLGKILIDPFDGLQDLENKIIRTVGDPLERFSEDGLRPIRACRFASQLNFKIEDKTFDAIKSTLSVVSKVSMERVHDELIKLMKCEKPSIGLEYLRESGLLNIYMPELLEGFEVDQNEFHLHDIYYHNVYACDAASPQKPLIRIAALLHDVGKARAKKYALSNGNGNVFYNHEIIGERLADRILKRLKFSNNDQRYITRLVKMHMFYYTIEWSDGAVRRFLRKIDGDPQFLNDLFELRRADRIGSGLKQGDAEILFRFRDRINAIIAADNALKVTDLDINGNEIMERFHIPPSRTIGEMLEYMLEKVLDNPEFNEKETLYTLGEEFLKHQKDGTLPSRKDEEEIPILV